MQKGDLILINGVEHRIIIQDNLNFCLNNLKKGGCLCHVAWKWDYLKLPNAEQSIRYDAENQTT
jgi:hypothetical protein